MLIITRKPKGFLVISKYVLYVEVETVCLLILLITLKLPRAGVGGVKENVVLLSIQRKKD